MIRVLVVDDEELVRRGLRMLLELTDGLEVIAEAADGSEALAMINRYDPDVVLSDALMPRMDGVPFVRAVRDQFGTLPVIILTTFDDDDLVRGAMAAGADGFLLKDTSPQQLGDGIRAVHAGRMVIDPRVARAALHRGSGPDPDPLAVLTRAERAVAELIPQGLTNAEVADRLSITEGTAKNHVSSLLRKLDCRDRVALVLLLQRVFS